MIKISVKGNQVSSEVDGKFKQLLKELFMANTSVLRAIASHEKIPTSVLFLMMSRLLLEMAEDADSLEEGIVFDLEALRKAKGSDES